MSGKLRHATAAALLASAVMTLAACGARSGRAASPSPIPPGAASPSTPGGPTVPADPAVAALNSRLLSQVSAPRGEADLPMGTGDLIEISVFEVEELSKLKLRIPRRGTITLPLIGQVQAGGRSAMQLEDDIRARLQQKFMHDPQVSVFVHEHTSQRISVTGSVRKGGVYPITSRLRVADALALGEGLTDEADHVIYLIRRVPAGTIDRMQGAVAPVARAETAPEDQAMVAIDLDALAAGRDELNMPLEAGDVIHVPRAGSYYVGGSVERPGSFFLKGKTTAEQAIMQAGGPKKVADWDDVRIYRTKLGGDREILKFNLNDFEKGDGQPAPELQKHDVVVLGQSNAKAVMFGVLDFIRGMFSITGGP